ncbi:MAG: hypothetical protein BroJett040_13760 [Oligoflexia bacterium]|nr:MAG: hypothetical protein BroJett040_13760 [Oligoflexia bacterium]
MLKDYVRFQTQSPELIAQIEKVEKLVQLGVPILIYGQISTGRRLMAEYIHDRTKSPMRLIKRIRSPLTQAVSLVSGDTVLIENIDELSFSEQQILLTLVRSHRHHSIQWVATAYSDLMERARKGFFQSDLAQFFTQSTLKMPSLNARHCDIPDLARQHSEVICLLAGKSPIVWTEAALQKLQNYDWKGNFSEFEKVVEKTVHRAEQYVIDAHDIHLSMATQILNLAEMEKKLVAQALELTRNNKTQAAKLLGISIRTLRNKLNEYRGEVTHESDLR